MKFDFEEETDIEDDKIDNLDNDDFLDDGFNDSGLGFNDGMTAMDKHGDLLKELTQFDDFLRIMITEWLGLVWNEETSKYERDRLTKPIMNVKGAKFCINFLRVYARKNNILTDLDRDSYLHILDDIISTAIINIGTRQEEFEIKTTAEAMHVWTQLIHSAWLVLIGASGNNNYKKVLTDTTNRSETLNLNDIQNRSQPMNRKVGTFDKVKRILGGNY